MTAIVAIHVLLEEVTAALALAFQLLTTSTVVFPTAIATLALGPHFISAGLNADGDKHKKSTQLF